MKKVFAFISLSYFLSLFLINQVFATEFSQAYVRLNSNKASAPLSGTICSTPSTAATGNEAKALITFPSDFSINSNISNFTTNTTNLPAGATSWPGIGSTASFINSKTVTLVSSDLTNDSLLYCFNFTASSSTTGSTGNKLGNITTKDASDLSIDSSGFGLSIVTNDQITITAVVPADPLDFTNSLTKTVNRDTFARNTRIGYRITYGSLLTSSTDLVIEASWSKGTVEGDSVASLDILEYVSGSADDAYGSTPPVIDIVNRKITWSIPVFPASLLNQKVEFKLKTADYYPYGVKSAFTVSSRLLPPGTSTTYKSVTSYLDPNYSEPSTSSSTDSSEETTTTTVAQQEVEEEPIINQVSINSITSENSSISIKTNDFSSVRVIYGENINNLNQSVSSLNSTDHLISLNDLESDTRYYFKIIVTDSTNRRTTSSIYTFTTAKDSSPLLADSYSLVATSNNSIISSLIQDEESTLVLPVDSVFQIKFAMNERLSAKDIQADIRNSNVLGIFSLTENSDTVTQSVNLIETQRGIYSGNLKTFSTPGYYALIARILDKNGNITEQKIANIKVINKFSVVSKANKNPVEGARVLLFLLSPSNNTYHIIPTTAVSNGNPMYTNSAGQLDLVLPQGEYKAEVTDLRHNKRVVEFEIGPENNHSFPLVELEPAKITIFGLFNYYKTAINDVFVYNTRLYSKNLTGSTQFFDLIALLSLGALVAITFFAFSKRHHIPLSHIPSYFYYLVDRKDKNSKYVHGVIYDEDDNPIKSANIYLMDKNDEKIISHKKTNKYGEFFFKKNQTGKNQSEYLIMAMAKGFSASPIFEYHDKAHLKFKINLKKEEERLHFSERIVGFFSLFAGLSFEVLLVISLLFEILFLNSFGVAKTLPFLIVTILNLALWILHIRSKSGTQVNI